MKNKLLVTVAAVALISGTTFALAQQEEKGAAPKAGATEQHAPSGGAMQHSQAPAGGMQRQPMAPNGAAQNQAAPEKGNAMQRGAEENAKPDVNAQEHAQTSPNGKTDKTEENAQTEERSKTQENAQSQDRNKTQDHAQSEDHGNDNPSAGKSGAGAKSAQLSETQRAQIKNVIVKDRNVARVDSVNFSISVGTAVPRSVHVAVLPVDIVTIVPEYRGFDYIVVGDQILIIDPNTLEIVDILPV
jgi:Protein of unknown function (DUF1236)